MEYIKKMEENAIPKSTKTREEEVFVSSAKIMYGGTFKSVE